MDSTGGPEHVNVVPHRFPNTQRFPTSKIVRRLENEFADLAKNPVENFELMKYPLKPLQWHFVFRGPKNTPFENGEYHGDLFFKNIFPFNPPILTFNFYNGRILRGHKIHAIEPRWWNCSMSTRDILNEVNSIFNCGAPRVTGTVFEEKYHLKILAERTKFTGCAFCGKQEKLTSSNPEYVEAAKRWKEIESKPVNESIGNWWNELRLVVIKNDELELEKIDKRKYEYCCERISAKIHSHLILLNWKTIARDVLAPIIYRYYLITVLIACLVLLIMIINDSDFKWPIRGLGIADLICIFAILLQECGAIYAFSQPRQPRGRARRIFGVVGQISIIAVVIHLIIVIIILILATNNKYKNDKTVIIVYIITAFANDFYHYIMTVFFCLNVAFHYAGCAIESVVTCKLGNKNKVYAAISKEYEGSAGKNSKTCSICKDPMNNNENLLYLTCNEDHVYHKECLTEIYKEMKRCPLCKLLYKIDSPIEDIRIEVR